MAAIIDGSTYKGYFKITPDDGAPLVFYALPKVCGIGFNGIDADGFNLVAGGGAFPSVTISLSIGNGVEDESGNSLTTISEILTYFSDNR